MSGGTELEKALIITKITSRKMETQDFKGIFSLWLLLMFSTMMMIINSLLTASLTPIRIYKMIFQESKKTQKLKITAIEVHFAGLSLVIDVIS